MMKELRKHLAFILIASLLCSNSVLATTIDRGTDEAILLEESVKEESNTPITDEESNTKKVDKDTLLVLMDEASTKEESLYTIETWQAFLDTYNKCLTLIELVDVEQETIDGAVSQLQKAMGSLAVVEPVVTTPEEPMVTEENKDPIETDNNDNSMVAIDNTINVNEKMVEVKDGAEVLEEPKEVISDTNPFTTEGVIDLSHDSPNPWGASFGIEADARYRWQTFKATKDGHLGTLEVYLIKVNEDKEGLPNEVIVNFYEVSNGQFGDILYTTTVPSNLIDSKEVTSIDIDVDVEKDKMYAVALGGNPLGVQDNDHARYDWANKDIGLDSKYSSGKLNPSNQVVDETIYVHTYWTRLTYEKPASDPIDYSFQGKRDWGFSFGITDGSSRWQTFTSNTEDRMTSIDVYVIKKNQFGLDFPNLIATLYEIENNLPSNILTSVTKPSGEIATNGIAHIDLPYDLEKDKQYAIGLSTDDIQDEDPSTATCYDWPTSNKGLAGVEFFGKVVGNNFVDESSLGTGYLVVNFGSTGPIVSKPTTMECTSDKTILEIDEETTVETIVKDQFGAVMDAVTVVYTSSDEAVATVDSNGKILAKGSGIAKILATCENVSEFITITVKDGQGLIIPVPGMVITEDMTFKPGVYNFEGASKGLIISGDNITVDGTGVTIYNAPHDQILEDVTTGAYAYELNPKSGKSTYHMTRHIDLRNANDIQFSFDAKATQYIGELKVQVNDGEWQDVYTVNTLGNEWSKHEVDLDAYAGKEVDLRVTYDGMNNSTAAMASMGLLVDTFELFEDGIRTFSDLAEAKVFYLWNLSYDDGNTVDDSLESKPFDRTTYGVNTGLFKGTAITIEGQNNVTIRGFKVHGFYYALDGKDCDGLIITSNDFSNNYTNPNGGWGDQNGGAVVLNNCNNGEITNNKATNNANGLYLKYSDNNEIRDNNFSVCSDVCLELWKSSYNTIMDNDFSWGIRIDPLNEVHARDSTSSLIEAGSNYNYVKNNDFTHGGDGIFVRALNGFVSEGNVFEKNDTSFANNNAVESGMGRNYYINNKANYSSYGFWMGGSDESIMIGNEIAYNGIKPANAPEEFGNAGISMKYWSSEHMVIVNNYIHDNNGTGIGMSYKKSQPSYHTLIQNNRIENNTRYPIYLDHAAWFEINGNHMVGNGYGNNVHLTGNASNVIQREGATYIESYEAYLQQVPNAKITSPASEFEVGQAINFSAASSTDPNNDSLSYRWDMGDGTILTGEQVSYVFKEPGFYDVAVTVSDGSWSDIDWMNVNVVGQGNEIGTEDHISQWEVTENNGKTYLINAVPNMTIPNVGDSSWVDYPIYYVVDGNKSIKMHSTSANSTMTYPKSKDAALDFTDDSGISFSMKIQNQNRDSSRSPIVTLHTDANNYITFTPTETLLSPFKYVDFTQMQYRHEWVAAVIPLEGNAMWVKQVTGNPNLSEINYISFNTVTGGTLGLDFWLDGLKTIPKGAEPYRGVNIAKDGTVIVSSSHSTSQNEAPLNSTVNVEEYWLSEVEETSFYGVTFNTPRYVNHLDFYVYYKPTGTGGEVIGLPTSPQIEYLKDGQWHEMTSQSISVIPDKNTLIFEWTKVEGIRLKLDNQQGKASALYGFKAYDTTNIIGELNGSNEPTTTVASNLTANKILESVDMYICLDRPEVFPSEYSDFKVYLYDISDDGKGPWGPALAAGTIPIGDIVSGGLNKPYNIILNKVNGEQFELEPGKRYALGATQSVVYDGGNTCYRWPVSKISSAASEDFGKFVSDANGQVTGFGAESFLGTGWMIIHTDQDEEGQPFLDYSYPLSHSTGFGVGHKGEDGRYQTFTMPINKVYDVIDGAYHNEAKWVGTGESGTVNNISLTFNESKMFNELGIYIETLPEQLNVIVNGTVVKSLTKQELILGYNVISLPSINADNIELQLTNGNEETVIKEIELRNITD